MNVVQFLFWVGFVGLDFGAQGSYEYVLHEGCSTLGYNTM